MWVWLLLGCAGVDPWSWMRDTPTPSVAPPPTDTHALPLARGVVPIQLELPATTRPAGRPPTDGFQPPRAGGKPRRWVLPLPFDPSLVPSPETGARTFGYYAPSGMTVRLDGALLPFSRGADRPGTWGYTRDALLIAPATPTPPDPKRVEVSFPEAVAHARSLHLETSGLAPEAFAQRSLAIDDVTTAGLLLPAPARALWTLDVPAVAVLRTRARILPPGLRDGGGSDGATLVVTLQPEGAAPREVGRVALTPIGPKRPLVGGRRGAVEGWTPIELPLDHVGPATLTLRTEGGAHNDLDLVFLEDPAVVVPEERPHHVILVFLDTVRRDHLGAYGYNARPTSPLLDAWADGALRLDDHRTVAPWTLPSARAVLSGREPELWYEGPTLADRFAAAGYVTEGIVANAYLSRAFDMDRGFGRYTYAHLQRATATVDQALAALERHADRDLLLYVQFMDAHLPYREPAPYDTLFDPPPKPDRLKMIVRFEVADLPADSPEIPALKDYLLTRYDQNLRYLDTEVARLLEAAGPDATVVIFSDHGEEFWEHGGFEHGHTLFDELLRVPTFVRDPKLAAGVMDAPTSHLDLTPTLLRLAGLPADGTVGADLTAGAPPARPLAFGRPLYGPDGWGVVAESRKWWSRSGFERLYDLRTDPAETRDVASSAPRADLPAALATALGREVARRWRVTFRPMRAPEGLTVVLSHPEGLEAAWRSYDPRALHDDNALLRQDDGTIHLVVPSDGELPRGLFVAPSGAPDAVGGFTVTLRRGGRETTVAVPAGTRFTDAAERQVALSDRGPLGVTVDAAWVPAPAGRAVSAYDPDMAAQLEELGYLDPEE